jgi:hypothetical protein
MKRPRSGVLLSLQSRDGEGVPSRLILDDVVNVSEHEPTARRSHWKTRCFITDAEVSHEKLISGGFSDDEYSELGRLIVGALAGSIQADAAGAGSDDSDSD